MDKLNIEGSNPFTGISSTILFADDIIRDHVPVECISEQGIIVSTTEKKNILIEVPNGSYSIGDSVDILRVKDANAILDENKYEKYLSLIEKANKGYVFTAHVTGTAKTGLLVSIDDFEAFIPQNHIEYDICSSLSSYENQDIDVKIISIKLKAEERNRFLIIASHKVLIEEESHNKFENSISVGDKISVKVKAISEYGVFVNIFPSVDGLIRLQDLSWYKVNPTDILSIGQSIEVIVLKIEESANSKKKIYLGLKQLCRHPWEDLDPNLKEGDIIEGDVSSITDFGLFLRLPCGVDGLVHWTQISWHKSSSWEYTVGEHAAAKVLSIDQEKRRLLLSIKGAEIDPWTDAERLFSTGAKVHGIIFNIRKKSGVFIRLQNNITGFIPLSEIFWIGEVSKLHELFQVGEEIDAVVMKIDNEKKSVILSIKRLFPDPAKVLSVGQTLSVSIVDIKDSGIIIHSDEFEQNGFIPNSQISQELRVNIGDRISCKVEEIIFDRRTILSA